MYNSSHHFFSNGQYCGLAILPSPWKHICTMHSEVFSTPACHPESSLATFSSVCCSHQGSCRIWCLPGDSATTQLIQLAGIRASRFSGSGSEWQKIWVGWNSTSPSGIFPCCSSQGSCWLWHLPGESAIAWLILLAENGAHRFPGGSNKQRKMPSGESGVCVQFQWGFSTIWIWTWLSDSQITASHY